MSVSIVHSEADLSVAAKAFSETLKPGQVILLYGEMGAGKTTFVRHVMTHLGCSSPVTSPTFTLVQDYAGSVPVYHLDLYRLETEAAVESIDIDKYVSPHTHVTFIEWPERLGRHMPQNARKVSLSYVKDGGTTSRQLTMD